MVNMRWQYCKPVPDCQKAAEELEKQEEEARKHRATFLVKTWDTGGNRCDCLTRCTCDLVNKPLFMLLKGAPRSKCQVSKECYNSVKKKFNTITQEKYYWKVKHWHRFGTQARWAACKPPVDCKCPTEGQCEAVVADPLRIGR